MQVDKHPNTQIKYLINLKKKTNKQLVICISNIN